MSVSSLTSQNGFSCHSLHRHKNHDFKVLSGVAIAQLEDSGNIDNLSDDIISEL